MQQSKRRFFNLVLVVVMLTVIFSGCGKKDPDAGQVTQSDTQTQADESQTNEQQAVAKDFYEFEIYWNYSWYDNSDSWDPKVNKIAQIIKDKFNIGFKVTCPSGDDAQKLNLMLASNAFPEVLVVDRNDKWVNLIKAGALVPLNNYIQKYNGYRTEVAENTIKMLEQDGESYGLACFSARAEHLSGNGGFVINTKIYEDLGSPKLDTLDDLYNYLVMVRDAGLTVNGQSVVPLEFKKDLNFDSLGVMWSTFGDSRYGGETGPNKVRKQGDKLELVLKDEKFDDLMLYMNKLYREKLLAQDYFVETSEQVAEKLASGRVAVFVSPDVHTQINSALQALEEAGSEYSYAVIEPPAAEGVNQADIFTSGGTTLGWNVCSISKDAEQPERIFEYLDWSVTPEGNRLIKHGPKGYMWEELDENGYPIILEGKDFTKKTPEYPLGANQLVGNSNYLNGAADAIALSSAKPPWEVKARAEVLSKHVYDGTEYANMIPVDHGTKPFEVYADTGQYFLDQYTKMIVAGSEEETLEVINATIKELERREFSSVEEYMNGIWKSNLELLGK